MDSQMNGVRWAASESTEDLLSALASEWTATGAGLGGDSWRIRIRERTSRIASKLRRTQMPEQPTAVNRDFRQKVTTRLSKCSKMERLLGRSLGRTKGFQSFRSIPTSEAIPGGNAIHLMAERCARVTKIHGG